MMTKKSLRLIPSLPLLLLVCFIGERCTTRPARASLGESSVFSLSCRDASLRDVLGQLAAQKGFNLAGLNVIPPSLTLTTHLETVSLEAGLLALLTPHGFTLEKRGDIYFVGQSPPETQRLSLDITDDTLSIDADRTDVNHVVRALADAGISVTSAADLTGSVTAHLRDQPLEAALPALFADYTLHASDGIYRVEPRGRLQEAGLTFLIADERISVTAHQASLTQLLSELAERAQINLSIVGEIERQITLRLADRTLSGVLTDLAQMTGHTYRREADLHFFGSPEIKPDKANPLIERKTIRLDHLDAKEVLNLLPIHIPKQNVVVSPAHNAVTVVGPRELIRETEQFLVELDTTDDAIRTRRGKGAIAIDVEDATGRLSVDLLDAPLFDVIRQLSIRTGTDVLFLGASTPPASSTESPVDEGRNVSPTPSDSLTDTITFRQSNATLESVLASLFLGSSYAYTWAESSPDDKPVLVVGSDMKPPFAEEELIALNYLDVPKAMELLPEPLGVHVHPLPDRSALLVEGPAPKIGAFREYLGAVDVPQPQAMIQLYLLELTKGNRDELGLSFETADNRAVIKTDDGLSVNFDSLARVPQAFGARLTALVKRERGKVLANPSLAVVNGKKASIDIGGKHLFETNNPVYPSIGGVPNQPSTNTVQPLSTVGGYAPAIYRSLFSIETGILLELTPLIGASGEVAMDIQLAIRDASQLSREASSLDQRLIQTTISVPDEGVVVIGGLLQEKQIDNVNRVPILNRIPLLGRLLFTSKETTVEQTELIVIIQPRVISR